MKTSIRSILAVAAIAIILAACAQTATDPTPSLEPSSPPSTSPSGAPVASAEPSKAPDASPEPIGVLTVHEGAVADGPGVPLADALDGDLSEPVLVTGTMVLDAGGQLFFTDSVTDASAPTFGDIRLRVENYPTDGPTWDVADAEITGLQEANGVRFYEDAKFYALIVLDR